MYFGFSEKYVQDSNSCRRRISAMVQKGFSAKEQAAESNQSSKANQSKYFDQYLYMEDDFKTNLMWLSIFIPSVEGVGMRLPVNYRTVDMRNYFAKEVQQATNICDAVYVPGGDTFQNSPIKLVFFAGFHKQAAPGTLNLSSISKVNMNASNAKLSQKKEYTNMTLVMEDIQCLWPRQEDLQSFLYLLGYHPFKNLGTGNHDFPWNQILSIFNDLDIGKQDVLELMLRRLGLGFVYDKNQDLQKNLAMFKNFIQFMTPIFCSAIEGGHRIELGNRLLYGVTLEEEAPFFKAKERSSTFMPLPFNSTVHKPIQAIVYLPAVNSSALSIVVTAHLMKLSRKTADQKALYIRDNWRSLYQSILTALENDDKFGEQLYSTQQDFYEDMLDKRQARDDKARRNRKRLSQIMADVLFAENPTSDLASAQKPRPVLKENWMKGLESSPWTTMDTNPFPAVGCICVFIWSLCLFTKIICQLIFVIPSLLF